MNIYTKQAFSAAHRLPDHPGKCRNLHGHTYTVEVWIEGTANDATGMVVDFGDIKSVINDLDHAALLYAGDLLMPILISNFSDMKVRTFTHPPTAETIASYLLNRLEEYIPAARTIRVRVWESETSYAELSN